MKKSTKLLLKKWAVLIWSVPEAREGIARLLTLILKRGAVVSVIIALANAYFGGR